jgi:hypothetical protein
MAADAPRNVARPIRPLHWNTLVLEERARAGRPSGVLPPRQLTRELHTATAIYWNEVLGATRCRGRQPERTEPELWVDEAATIRAAIIAESRKLFSQSLPLMIWALAMEVAQAAMKCFHKDLVSVWDAFAVNS